MFGPIFKKIGQNHLQHEVSDNIEFGTCGLENYHRLKCTFILYVIELQMDMG